jgi:hypothetical protein
LATVNDRQRDLAEEINALKREPGKDLIAWGGAAFAQSLSRLAWSTTTGWYFGQ